MNDLMQRIAVLSPEKLELLLRQTQSSGLDDGKGAIPPRAHPEAPARLSFAQERLWFLYQLDPGDPRYNMHGSFRLTGRLDLAALASALDGVIARHDILRTVFAVQSGRPVQTVAPQSRSDVEVVRLASGPLAERLAECRRRARENALHPFDLAAGPPLRAILIGLAEEDWVISVAMHHIVSDGWSLGVFIGEFAALYTAATGGERRELPRLPIQFADFAEWQRDELSGEFLARQLGYWRQQLEGAPPVLELVTDRPRPAVQSWHGAEDRFQLSRGVTRGLRELGARHQATLYMVLLAAYQILLGRYSGQEDVLVGSPVAGRGQVETEGLIGPFVNTVVRRTVLAGAPVFSLLLERVRDATLAADAHCDLPFEKLVEELRPERSPSHSLLFQVWFVFHNTPAATLDLPALTLGPFEVHGGTAKFDLTLSLVERDDVLAGAFEYNSDLFDAATIRALREQFETLCAGLVADPERPISLLPLAEPAPPARSLRRTAVGEDLSYLLHVVAQRSPQRLALLCGGERWTYSEVDRRTNQLAQHLQALGVGPGVLVGLCVQRAVDRLLAVLAIWKAGGAAVPLDPAYPQERLELLLEDTGVPVLLTESDLIYQLPTAAAACDLVCLDTDGPAIESSSPDLPDTAAGAWHPAYVLYTSGSTGHPKGVVVTRGALVEHCMTMAEAYGLTAGDRVLQFASLSFDPAFEQIVTAFLAGATLVPRDGEIWSIRELETQVRSLDLTVVNLPTAFWQQWACEGAAEPCPALRLVIAGGDVLSPEATRRWQQGPLGRTRLINAYGPTEGIITAVLYDVPPLAEPLPARVPIGHPPPGRTAVVLDAAGQPAPPGIPGEIHLGDPFLAVGYLGYPEATAMAFVPDPWSTVPGARLYRTGDLARRRADGVLEFLGRRDFQHKIRGFRVELGEVEEALRRYRKVREAVVAVRGESADERRLVAYLSPVREDEPASASELREFLADTLPEHMLPSSYVVLGELPRTVTGKIDRSALPERETDPPSAGAATVAPRNATEEAVAALWCKVLGVAGIGIHDDFFDLGGHSLLGTQVISRVLERFGVDLPLQALFTAPTVAGLAACVDAALAEEDGGPALPAIAPVPRDGDLPLSFAQQRLWLFEQLEPGTVAYNVAAVLDLAGRLDVAALSRSFAEIVKRHEVLRTTFAVVDGSPVQVIEDAVALPLHLHDLTGLAPGARRAASERFAAEEVRRPFDLGSGPLARASLLRLGDEEHVLLVVLHHIVSDGWSVGILMREAAVLYAAFLAGRPSPLPSLPVQYADFAAWQRQWQESEPLRRQLAYWRDRLGDLPTLDLPADQPRPLAPSYRGAQLGFRFDTGLSQSLRELSQSEGATLFMTLLAAFKVLLYRYSGQQDVVVGTAVANRRRSELEDLIGFFVNLLVLRTDLGGNPSFREGLRRVKETTLGALANQDLSFDRLVEELSPERLRSRNALFQVLFLLQASQREALQLPGLAVQPRGLDSGSSHFDLVLEIVDGETELRGNLQYDTDLFEAATAEQLLRRFEQLLRRIVEVPEMGILQLALGEEADVVSEAGPHRPYEEDEFLFDAGR
jgi:amino acid adenylation domain-containing protein